MNAKENAASPLRQFDATLMESTRGWLDESQLKEARGKVESLLVQVAAITGVDRDSVERGLSAVQIRQGRRLTRIGLGGGFGHGPLDPIIPHDCHITIVLCNPLPWGPQVCVEIELPWPCGPA